MPAPKKPIRNAAIPEKGKWTGGVKISGKPQPNLKGHAQKPRKGHNM